MRAALVTALVLPVLWPGSSLAKIACPNALVPGDDAVALAAHVALRHTDPSTQPEVVEAILAPYDSQRGPEARRQCGRKVWRRTIVVYLKLHKFEPSASLSSRIEFLSRTARGWKIWEVVH